ncbi:helix-turn-helix domain-containing protein [Fusicatenibacter saccharivorans]|uniref:helix-turn-helix domain-containing protein n=1 Tax=Fusicatenibacter saccharivorans TaxID=1150298 RepID=UPI003F8B20AD
MDIGVVIKKYRKEAGMTQEEMANRLGVTTQAVNKWENSNSKPDIELLAPIARLLDISLDTLLSFHEKLSDTEIEEIIRKMDRMFSEEGYEKTYEWALRLIKEYPNCNMLIWQTAVMLDARRITDKCTNQEKYDKQINAWYELYMMRMKRYSIMQQIPYLDFIYVRRITPRQKNIWTIFQNTIL